MFVLVKSINFVLINKNKCPCEQKIESNKIPIVGTHGWLRFVPLSITRVMERSPRLITLRSSLHHPGDAERNEA